ncbi:hypothetical protein NLJ89_g7625 [Agrocybe chaxingu]|uniref:Calcium-dependent phosphotriesterase n=1 Tax=Agrocybe chaxingu TaxID=84603 RepID=A0A9W8JWU5_9AGAR|nr:hypothetical protein NLJ89_g7625 [Agrocybe chaxingu]
MGTATRLALNILVVLLAIAGGFYQLHFRPLLRTWGTSPVRVVQPLSNKKCKAVPELKACEKIVLHQPTGVIYLACSTPQSRKHWTPSYNLLDATGASTTDYVATYDPSNSYITRLTTPNFNNGRGLSLHGMDVVPSSTHPEELFVYLVNHRIPMGDKSASEVGADSAVEVFKTTEGGRALTHFKTVEDPAIITPNDIVGADDGQSFFFTNDNGIRVGFTRYLGVVGHKAASVGYCHIDDGCKFALQKTHSSNGIASAPNGTLYVGDSTYGGVTILERQTDNTLVVTDSIATGRIYSSPRVYPLADWLCKEYTLNNLALDADGQLWAAGMTTFSSLDQRIQGSTAAPQTLTACHHLEDPESKQSPSAALRISINTGPNAFYGEKFKVQKMFEDAGDLMSGITSAVYDSERKKLFMHGIASPQLVVCDI